MDLTYTDEQELFRKSVRGFVEDRLPPDRLAEIADGDTGWDPGLWTDAVALGLAGVTAPEERGGAGMGFLEETIVAEELGRAVFPGPWLGSVVLTQAALAEAPDQLEEVVTGKRIATLVPLGGRRVVDLAAADLLVVETAEGLSTIDREDVDWRILPTVDGTRRLGEVDVRGTAGTALAGDDAAGEILRRTRIRALAALAAEARAATRP